MSRAPIIDQLAELRSEAETDEFGILRPSEHAFRRANQLMLGAAELAELRGHGIPRGCASTDTEGGIRIDWLRPAAAVCLIIHPAANSEPYVYHEIAGDYSTEPATAEGLVRWLHEMESLPWRGDSRIA